MGTYIVQVDIGTTVMRQDKVANRVCALDGVLVAIESVQEPGVLGSDKVARLFVSPQLRDELATQSLSNKRNAAFNLIACDGGIHVQYTHSQGASQCSSAGPHATPREWSRSCMSGG